MHLKADQKLPIEPPDSNGSLIPSPPLFETMSMGELFKTGPCQDPNSSRFSTALVSIISPKRSSVLPCLPSHNNIGLVLQGVCPLLQQRDHKRYRDRIIVLAGGRPNHKTESGSIIQAKRHKSLDILMN
ncbi:hypothetical protein I7I53_06020 [Histoplasma capsulatum var. duboisii H88]|uniref:Uncharacterized protein n=1 Tax=Ajellomyces capsulatus (strain H88) TaxID=544711 RepID=A0A8A1LDC6_AJEC8|nr:hypothetical protein I7I53_06020 [Histoplasma capsulatum var. duboisii H88]